MLRGRLFKEVLASGQVISKRGSKNWDIKWTKERKAKTYKIDLPDFDKMRREMKLPPNEQQSLMKKEGKMPPRYHQDRPIIIASTSTIFEAYIPSEGDGLMSSLTKGAKEKMSELEMKRKSMLQLRKIKAFDEDIDIKEFPDEALSIYTQSLKLLQNVKENQKRLHELLTEKAYPEMVWKLERKTLRWAYVSSTEAARVVHVRTTEMLSKENIYAQITVRFRTKQIIALYDQYGRLMYGHADRPKEVLEFVVFEKHLANEYGAWRVHGKIRPAWMGESEAVTLKTAMMPLVEGGLMAKEVSLTESQGL